MKPDLDALAFDLEHSLDSIVSLRAVVPEDALTAPVLGTERAGHGVVIGPGGLILTIGYLITEAEAIWLLDRQGRTCPGYVMGYDQETGFGLVQALQPMGWPHLELGESRLVAVDDQVIIAGQGGIEQAIAARVLAKREFAGYWEYVIDDALFTAPAHPNWGGAALLDAQGRLCGIGSLLVQTLHQDGEQAGANMVVPIDLLKPILEDLRAYGRQNKPPRPWLGWLVQEVGDQLVVAGVYDDCPADQAGIEVGDVIIEVDAEPVDGLGELFRRVWALGAAGVTVPLTLMRDGDPQLARIESIDRSARLKAAPLH